MSKANFFIIGAPKCGTSSLANWLSKHPKVYVSPVKEPFYFSDDLNMRRASGIEAMSQYEALFERAKEYHVVRAEASTTYIYSQTAVSNILEYNSDARFLAIVRDPVEMFFSYHAEQLAAGNENETDPIRAWRLSDKRSAGAHIPAGCIEPKMIMYPDVCALGSQLRKTLQVVPANRIKIFLAEELYSQPVKVLEAIIAFMGLEKLHCSVLENINKRKKLRNRFAYYGLKYASRIKRRAGVRRSFGLGRRLFFKSTPKKNYPDSFIMELKNYFAGEVDLMEVIVGENLDHWRKMSKGKRY